MTQHETFTELPTYLAPGAFEALRPQYSHIFYNPGLLDEASAHIHKQIGRGLPGSAEDITFVYRFAEPGYERPTPDPDYFKANPAALYYPVGQLAIAPTESAVPATKGAILAGRKPVMQVDLKDGELPSIETITHSILYPPAEDMRMKASLSAWGRQFKDAFNPRESVKNKAKIMGGVSRFAGAVILGPRAMQQ